MSINDFTEKDHAITFISIAKVLESKLSMDQFNIVMTKFVEAYGQRRGERMALMAEKSKLKKDIYSYIGCGEYNNTKNSTSQVFSKHADGTLVTIAKCPWMEIWEKTGNVRIGKYYCDNIDKALFEGFQGNAQLSVIRTMPNGCASCQFIYHDLKMDIKAYYKIITMKVFNPGKAATRSWEFHVGDLISTIHEVLKNHGIVIDDFESLRLLHETGIRSLVSSPA